MAQRHDELTDAGVRVVGISVDPVGANAAMVDKLDLPFPLLSDPDGEGAIKPYGVWHDEPSLARPALVLVTPDGDEAWRRVSRDFADRSPEDEAVKAAGQLDLDATTQATPTPGDPAPSSRAMPLEAMPPYFRGARFASKAMAMRVPEAQPEAEALGDEMERYAEAVKALRQRRSA